MFHFIVKCGLVSTEHNVHARACAFLCTCIVIKLCLSLSRAPPQAVINTMCGQGMQGLPFLQAGAFIHTNGCIDKLVNWIHSNLFMLGGIALGLAIPQVDITHTCIVYFRVGVHLN